MPLKGPATPIWKYHLGHIFERIFSILIQRIKILICTKFQFFIVFYSRITINTPKVTVCTYPSLKIAFWGTFFTGYVVHLVQCTKIHICAKFQLSIIVCSGVTMDTPFQRNWVQVPQSLNSIWGQI